MLNTLSNVFLAQDVQYLIRELDSSGHLLENYAVPYPQWNHVDFLFGLDAKPLVFDKILDHLANLD
jgi:hypothetical protein